jgi:pfkB family carbohydrate kinase
MGRRDAPIGLPGTGARVASSASSGRGRRHSLKKRSAGDNQHRAGDRLQVVVVGSFAVGVTIRMPRLPVLGESLMGDAFDLGPGGKGSNMTTALGRLGIKAGIIATVGDDSFGDLAFDHFAHEGVDTRGLRRVSGCRTAVGLALVLPAYPATRLRDMQELGRPWAPRTFASRLNAYATPRC